LRTPERLDPTDVRLLLALQREPRSTVVALANSLGLARNTVQSRLNKLERLPGFGPLGAGVDPALFGYPLTAQITLTVQQRHLDGVAAALAGIPQIIEVLGVSGEVDMLARVVAAEADDLYRLAGRVLAIEGVERTRTALVMRRLVDHRLEPLLEPHH
jgi:DNA-binding Lrp family transcriptional regulator